MAYSRLYHDLVLLGIGLSLGVGATIGSLTPVGLPTAAVVSGGAGALLIGHGLFLNGPVDAPERLAGPVDALN